MNSLTENMPVEVIAISRATVKDRLLTVCYLTAISIAMLGWLSAFGWVTVAVAKWLLA
jgi:ABC-type enterochelin transport system permease subunit